MNISATQFNFVASLAIFVGGAVYLGVKFISLHDTFAIDFDYIWLSGKVWSTGQSPYSSVFGEAARTGDQFKGTKPPDMFGYPFNWALPAMAFAELRLETATFLWRAASIIAMASSALLVFVASRSLVLSLGVRDVLITLGYLFLMQATPIALSHGQTGWVILLGLSLIFYGAAFKGTVSTAIGLTLVMLKPNIGLPVLATLAVVPSLWPAIIIAGVLTIAMSVPAFVVSGVFSTVTNFLENIHQYPLYSFNNAATMTGIRNLIWELTKQDVNSILLTCIASLAAIASTLTLRQIFGQDTQALIRALFVTLTIILAVVPLHTYDFVIVAPMVFLCLGHQHAARWLVLLALAMIFRADNVGKWTGFHSEEATVHFVGGLINSLASIPLLVGSIWLLFARNRPVSAISNEPV